MNEVTGSAAKMDVGEHGLKKHDIKVSTVVFMIFCLVAAGAYGIEEMIPEAGPGLTIVMLIVLPFIWSTPFGLVAAELGSARPQEGGYYKWVQEACGEFWGFQAGWWRTISIYIDNSLYVILAGGYIASTWNLTAGWEFAAKALIILIFTWINIRGVKDVGIVSSILSVLVIVAFAMVAIIGFLNWNQNPMIPFTPEPVESAVDWIFYIGGGISIGMWMYSGYESMSTIAGEVSNPQVIPKATLITVPLIMAVYIFPTIAGLASLGDWPNWGTEPGTIGYADVATHFLGPASGIFFAVVAVLAQCSIYNTYIASGSRGFFALADDNLAPPILVKCDKKHGVPYISVLSVAIVNLILCSFDFSTVVVVDVFLLVASYVLVFISALILRKRIPDSERPFKIPGGYGFLVVICVLPMIVAFISFFINGTDYFIGGMIGIVSGPILYIIWRKMYGGLSKKDPIAFPKNEKTGLALGDLKRMAYTFLGIGVIGILGRLFLPWYEADWGAEYYLEEYETGLLSNWSGMIHTILIAAIIFLIIGVIISVIATKVEPKKVK
ncbi:APC family permease [Anaerovorax odorimutans]|uniref:APC family permease n=1 Tax=Anaerovorax odorimutans TaxID=109327 RepID=UPI0004274A9A|nr:APC family permease [Anaerovorax odorimutans]